MTLSLFTVYIHWMVIDSHININERRHNLMYINWIVLPLKKSLSAPLLLLLRVRQGALGALKAGTEVNSLRHIAIVDRQSCMQKTTLITFLTDTLLTVERNVQSFDLVRMLTMTPHQDQPTTVVSLVSSRYHVSKNLLTFTNTFFILTSCYIN